MGMDRGRRMGWHRGNAGTAAGQLLWSAGVTAGRGGQGQMLAGVAQGQVGGQPLWSAGATAGVERRGQMNGMAQGGG